MNTPAQPHPRLVELSKILVGRWRVDGPQIEGQAEYRIRDDGRLLVAFVDFRVDETRMRVIQHISYDRDRNVVLARYMDTMGDEATYTWVLESSTLRVTLDEASSETYFQAILNEDRSQYSGTWHYPDAEPPDETERIVYTRVHDDG